MLDRDKERQGEWRGGGVEARKYGVIEGKCGGNGDGGRGGIIATTG